jgi:hypothetical protein
MERQRFHQDGAELREVTKKVLAEIPQRSSASGHDTLVSTAPNRFSRSMKLYLKRQKNDAADAEAICEGVTRPLPSPRR